MMPTMAERMERVITPTAISPTIHARLLPIEARIALAVSRAELTSRQRGEAVTRRRVARIIAYAVTLGMRRRLAVRP